MTGVAFVLGCFVRTPTVLWITAMICDTFLIATYIVAHAVR